MAGYQDELAEIRAGQERVTPCGTRWNCCRGSGDATDMPGMMSQAGLARVPGVTPGCAGRLARAGRNKYPAAGDG
jgi:hypothetical protein